MALWGKIGDSDYGIRIVGPVVLVCDSCGHNQSMHYDRNGAYLDGVYVTQEARSRFSSGAMPGVDLCGECYIKALTHLPDKQVEDLPNDS